MKFGAVIMAVIIALSGLCACSVEEAPAEIPDIVFLRTFDPNDDSGLYSCDFYDKNGDHYITTDPYVCGLTVREILTEYAAGELDDMITLHTSCDKEEMTENYVKMYRAARGGNCGLAYPNEVPTVEAERTFLYGIYYDESGEVKTLPIHAEEYLTQIYSADKRLNEVYDWFIGTFR